MTERYTTSEERLAAWTARDKAADGAFYVGVKTTRIYCRPTCGARPKVENLIWFSDKPSTESGGFRACKRCKP
ncbi:MAG: Ada metal-binding domain-containing protein [Proteobacteria bacterium]|nr:Ada metal-binding domain-containing protein [Pseudomonadota bacterium]